LLKRAACSSLLLVLLLMPSVQAAHIIWVTETRDTDVDGIQDDQAFIDLLEAEGHTVDAQADHWKTLDGAKVAALNNADLVIVSRASSSGNYDETGEPHEWNSLETPLILMNVYISRSSRWLWVDSTSIQNLVAPTMEVSTPGHAVFVGVALDENNDVNALDGSVGSGQTSFLGTTHLGNGTLLAAAGTNIWIAEWEPGMEFYVGSAQAPAERRLLLCGGTQEVGATAQGAYNYTEQGESIFLNAVKYMLGTQCELASAPVPESGAHDVTRNLVLSWTPGICAHTHDVYLGMDLVEVNGADRDNPLGVLISQGQEANTLDVGQLELDRAYYWRVDEVNSVLDNAVLRGEVWSFTTEALVCPVETVFVTASGSHNADMGPEKTIDGSGLDTLDRHSTVATDMWLSSAGHRPWIQFEFNKVLKLCEMWVWNSNQAIEAFVGLGAKDVAIETSAEGREWTLLEDATEFVQATGTANYSANTVIDFKGAMARFVRITINANYGMMPEYGLSEVRFFHVPVQAEAPQPIPDVTTGSVDVELTWRAGREAVSHELHFGMDHAAVTNGSALLAITRVPRFDLADQDLAFGTTYFWRVDEVNENSIPLRHVGELWSFTTAAYLEVEGFEPYDDACKRIFFTWLDGWGHHPSETCGLAAYDGNGSGAIVGNATAPFAEKILSYPAGGQSMPLVYDNSLEPYYSEASSAAYALPSDWAHGNPKILSLYYQGSPSNDVGQLYLSLEDNASRVKVVKHPDPMALQSAVWQEWQILLSEFSALDLSSIKKLTIGVGDQDDAQAGGMGTLYIDNLRVGTPIQAGSLE
jgi:hypothetical protein